MKSDRYVAEGVPVIRGNNLSDNRSLVGDFPFVAPETADELRSSNVFANDLVFPHRGAIGMVGIIPVLGPPRWMLSTSLMKLTCDAEVADPLFIFYYFRSSLGRNSLLEHSSSVGTPGIGQPLASLRSIRLGLPPLDTQRKIAAILSAYDDQIENNNRRIKLLEEMAQRLYREWLVDFRHPGHENFPLVDSELGPIPHGWSVEPFAKLGNFVNGYAFGPEDWGTTGLPIIKIRELKNGVTDETPRYANALEEKYVVRDGDLLFSWSAHLDAYLWAGGPAWLNQHLFRVDPAAGIASSFLFHALRERMEEFRSRAQGTTMRHIKRSALGQVFTIVPPQALQKAMVAHLAPIDALTLGLVRSVRNLRTSRDLLLPLLISGEIDVADLDILVPEAVA